MVVASGLVMLIGQQASAAPSAPTAPTAPAQPGTGAGSTDGTDATSGTGTSGMEAIIANLVQEGTRVLVVVTGYFGERLVEMCRRYGADITRVDVEWGRAADPQAVRQALAGGFVFEPRGPIQVKGVGRLHTWLLKNEIDKDGRV